LPHTFFRRVVRSRALYLAGSSRTDGAHATAPAHACAAAKLTRDASAPAFARPVAYSSDLKAITPLSSTAPSPCILYRRAVRLRPLYLAVPSRTGGAHAITPAHSRAAAGSVRGARAPALARVLALYSSKKATALLSSTAPSPRTYTIAPYGRTLSIFPCCPILAVLLRLLQRTPAPLLNYCEVHMRQRSFGPWRSILA